MAKKIRFRLYAMEPTEENIACAFREEYHRITPEYVLIYTRRGQKSALELSGEDLLSLSDMDWMWLQECNVEILEKFVSEHEDSLKKSRDRFASELLDELQREEDNGKTEEATDAGTEEG